MTQAHRLLLKWARTLHVYLTLFGFVLLLFFAVTGFMLNHEDWFLPQQTTQGKIPTELLSTPENRDAIIEKLTGDFGAQGDLESFELLEGQNAFRVVFRAKGGHSDAFIRRDTGDTVVTVHSDKQVLHRVTITEGKMPMKLLVPEDKSKELPIVEKLRADFGVRGAVKEASNGALITYEKDTELFRVDFKAPGYDANVTIRASDGDTRVEHRSRGLNGIFLDLHRGKESGEEWKFIIDAVSVLFVMVSITGLILWSSLRGRAQHGLVVLMLGLAISLVAYFIYVPR